LGLRLAVGAMVLAAAIVTVLLAPAVWHTWRDSERRIAVPAHVDDLLRDDSPGAQDTADQLRDALTSHIRLTARAGAVYADRSGRPRSVILVAGRGSLTSPRRALEQAFAITAEQAGEVHDVRDMPAGPRGGVLRCGVTSAEGAPMPVSLAYRFGEDD